MPRTMYKVMLKPPNLLLNEVRQAMIDRLIGYPSVGTSRSGRILSQSPNCLEIGVNNAPLLIMLSQQQTIEEFYCLTNVLRKSDRAIDKWASSRISGVLQIWWGG